MDEVFFPTDAQVKMDNGNWIMYGMKVDPEGFENDGWTKAEAAVAISHGNDLIKWDRVAIPRGPAKMWGESAVIVQGARILNVARSEDPEFPSLLVAVSEDYGSTWTPSQPSNLPVVHSKPCAGVLSNGQRYVIGTTNIKNDYGAYSFATEHEGKLYVGYSAPPKGKLPLAEGKKGWNRNAAELAIIPIESLAADGHRANAPAKDSNPWQKS